MCIVAALIIRRVRVPVPRRLAEERVRHGGDLLVRPELADEQREREVAAMQAASDEQLRSAAIREMSGHGQGVACRSPSIRSTQV